MQILEEINQFIRYCSVEEGLAPKTVNSIESYLKTFQRRTSVVRLTDITLDVLREFFYESKETHRHSVNHRINNHKYLKKFMGWGEGTGLLKENLMLKVKRPKTQKNLPRRLTEDEAKKILYTAFSLEWRYHFEKIRNHALIATLLFSGVRVNELLNIKIIDLDLVNGNILIQNGKGGKDRNVPIYHKLKGVLKNYIKERKEAGKKGMWLFTGFRSDKKLSYKNVYTICKKIYKDCGIKFTPHQLRHTFASVAIEQGLDVVKLSAILGHSEITSTMIYLKMSSKSLKEGLNKLDIF